MQVVACITCTHILLSEVVLRLLRFWSKNTKGRLYILANRFQNTGSKFTSRPYQSGKFYTQILLFKG